jgi:hypothetical protein
MMEEMKPERIPTCMVLKNGCPLLTHKRKERKLVRGSL